jgi:hypothetical protein
MEVGYTPRVAIVMEKINGVWQMYVTTPNIIPLTSNIGDEDLPLVGFMGTCPMFRDVDVLINTLLANVND